MTRAKMILLEKQYLDVVFHDDLVKINRDRSIVRGVKMVFALLGVLVATAVFPPAILLVVLVPRFCRKPAPVSFERA